MKVLRILGINAHCVTGSMDDVTSFFRDVLGAKIGPDMPWRAQYGHRARGVWLGTEEPFRLELSESISDEHPVGRAIKNTAPSFQNLVLVIDDIDEAITELRAKGLKVHDKLEMPDPGWEGYYETMIHPKSSLGLLIELIEFKKCPPEGEF